MIKKNISSKLTLNALFLILTLLSIISLTLAEEKIAEIRDMIQAGKVDDAKKALSHYQQFAKRTEQDISPDQQEQTRKSAVAISRVMTEIKDDIPAEHQQDFVLAGQEKYLVQFVSRIVGSGLTLF